MSSLSTVDDVSEYGPIEMDKDAVRQLPLTLPEQFEWVVIDIMDDEQVGMCVRVCLCRLEV